MLKKKIKKLLIGTNNKGKLREIRDLLPKYINTVSTKDYNLKRTISACIFAQKQNSESFDAEKAKTFCKKKIEQNLKFSE